ncbi:unnamed protein product [Commensalibacter communis]|nr:unnamed protein product [Commensalibacter communis]
MRKQFFTLTLIASLLPIAVNAVTLKMSEEVLQAQ